MLKAKKKNGQEPVKKRHGKDVKHVKKYSFRICVWRYNEK